MHRLCWRISHWGHQRPSPQESFGQSPEMISEITRNGMGHGWSSSLHSTSSCWPSGKSLYLLHLGCPICKMPVMATLLLCAYCSSEGGVFSVQTKQGLHPTPGQRLERGSAVRKTDQPPSSRGRCPGCKFLPRTAGKASPLKTRAKRKTQTPQNIPPASCRHGHHTRPPAAVPAPPTLTGGNGALAGSGPAAGFPANRPKALPQMPVTLPWPVASHLEKTGPPSSDPN